MTPAALSNLVALLTHPDPAVRQQGEETASALGEVAEIARLEALCVRCWKVRCWANYQTRRADYGLPDMLRISAEHRERVEQANPLWWQELRRAVPGIGDADPLVVTSTVPDTILWGYEPRHGVLSFLDGTIQPRTADVWSSYSTRTTTLYRDRFAIRDAVTAWEMTDAMESVRRATRTLEGG